GWWVILGILSVVLIIGLIYAIKRYKYNKSWQGKAYKSLLSLEESLAHSDLKPVVHNLSEQLRHIAIAKSSRKNCAGLTAQSWLQWLQDNDPNSFRWTTNARFLVLEQYAPEVIYTQDQIQNVIAAAKRWVAK